MPCHDVLFLGGGRRVSMAREFYRNGYRVHSYEIKKEVPIALVANVVVGLHWDDDEVIQDILKKCKELMIDVVVPFDDKATVLLSQSDWDVPVVVSPLAEFCYDKARFHAFMTGYFPEIYPGDPLKDGEAVLKPRWGYGSRGIKFLSRQDDKLAYNDNYIVQQRVYGTEYSVDAYFNKEGRYVAGVSRTRDRVANGEVLDSTVRMDHTILAYTAAVGEKLRLVGPTCFQFIKSEEDGNLPQLIEVNARFGGGAVLSLAAGLPMVNWLTDEYVFGRHVPAQTHCEIEDGLYMCRANQEIFFEREAL